MPQLVRLELGLRAPTLVVVMVDDLLDLPMASGRQATRHLLQGHDSFRTTVSPGQQQTHLCLKGGLTSSST